MTQGVAFREFMERALYGPDGYYTVRRPELGRRGDFFTNVHVSPLYGELWASFVLARIAPVDGRYSVLELGCGDGRFASAFLPPLVVSAHQSGATVLYAGIDVSDEARRRLERTLERTAEELGPLARNLEYMTAPDAAAAVARDGRLRGSWVFGNEVLDALPCDIVRCDPDGETLQLFVVDGSSGGVPGPFRDRSLATVFREADRECRHYAERYLLPIVRERCETVIAEAHTGLAAFLSGLIASVQPQALAFVDYGGHTVDIVSPDRPLGSLRAYRSGRVSTDLLQTGEDGPRDLTFDVDFSVLSELLASDGYDVDPVQRQGAFLVALPDFSRVVEAHMRLRSHPSLAVRQLVLPGAMGDRFLVCCAGRRNVV